MSSASAERVILIKRSCKCWSPVPTTSNLSGSHPLILSQILFLSNLYEQTCMCHEIWGRGGLNLSLSLRSRNIFEIYSTAVHHQFTFEEFPVLSKDSR